MTIISSLLDTDLYKFTMMQVVLHHFPGANVEYHYKCRNEGIDLKPYINEIRDEISNLCHLHFQEKEVKYLRSMRFFKSDFIDFLTLFHLQEKYITLYSSATEKNEIEIIVKGPWLHTILFEVPVLAIVNEVYFRSIHRKPNYVEGRRRLQNKIVLIRDDAAMVSCKVADYGTRRRFSQSWHEEVIQTLKRDFKKHLVGTSNVYFAMKYNITPLGTMAHEYLQACQSLGPRLRDSQIYGFEMWAKEYRGDLGIALSDVYGLSAFLRDFDLYFCKLFDGARHDSGDPFDWGERLINHYKNNRVDPSTKTLVFSDSLDFSKVNKLYLRFKDRVQVAFGVGTNLTNDLGYTPLQIVMKMVRCNGQPVAKLSDTPSKNMCDDQAYLNYLRQVFDITEL
jgi:nicotinate phosphoribosyltransferase